MATRALVRTSSSVARSEGESFGDVLRARLDGDEALDSGFLRAQGGETGAGLNHTGLLTGASAVDKP